MTLQPTDSGAAVAVSGQPQAPAVVGGTIAVDDVRSWLERAEMYGQLAHTLVRSFFVPAAFKPQIARGATPDDVADAFAVAEANATGAMMLGGALGLDPLTSLQNLYVVHGRPGMYTRLKVALVQAAGHEVWTEHLDDDRAVVCGRRAGTDQVVRVEITMDMAKTAEWTTNAAYRKTPRDILYARAASRVCDRVAADLLMGIRSVEDIDPDEAPSVDARVTSEEVRARAAALTPRADTRTIREIGAQASETLERERAEAERDEPDTAPDVPPSTAQQHREIGRLFTALGVVGDGSRARRARAVSDLVGRSVTSATDLTGPEAGHVIDELTAMAEGPTDQDDPAPTGELADQVEDPPGWDPDGGEVLIDLPDQPGAGDDR